MPLVRGQHLAGLDIPNLLHEYWPTFGGGREQLVAIQAEPYSADDVLLSFELLAKVAGFAIPQHQLSGAAARGNATVPGADGDRLNHALVTGQRRNFSTIGHAP